MIVIIVLIILSGPHQWAFPLGEAYFFNKKSSLS